MQWVEYCRYNLGVRAWLLPLDAVSLLPDKIPATTRPK